MQKKMKKKAILNVLFVLKKNSVSNIGGFSVEPGPLVKVYCSKKK